MRRVGAIGVLGLLLALVAGWWATNPPAIPSYAATRAAWRTSDAALLDRHGHVLQVIRVAFDARRLPWVPLDRIAPAVRREVLSAEDRRFLFHNGVDRRALAASMLAELHGRHRGASTITMQLAAFLAPALGDPGSRGLLQKLRQMRAAWAIERRWTKPEILEAYLNMAPFRGEAEGIGAASDGLFGRTPDALGEDEARLLAALLPSPQAAPDAVAARACRLAPRDACARLTLEAASLDTDPGPAREPALAPHLAAHLLRTPGESIATTLDMRVQQIAIAALREQLGNLGDRVRDGAAVVVDNRSGDVLAYVGGVGGASTAAQVDGADAPRQAGSTLKPFLYGQAIERGFLTPASILDDSPVELDTASGLYVPHDYDHDFKGPVSVRTALAGSLNVPAVRTLLLDGVEDFRDRLWDLGYTDLTESGDYYGFSLALGSAEVTLVQQATAYRALAMGGRTGPLRLRLSDAPSPLRPIMTPEAAWIVADMLGDADARAVTFGLDSALRLPFWSAAKTGTSKAMRDNWCIGISDRFTVAVWVGNLEGDSMRRVSGTAGAAPVWRTIMLALHANSPAREPPPPPGVDRRYVRFADRLEPARDEVFLHGTGEDMVTTAAPVALRPHIVSPVSGTVYAVDPDIPDRSQRIRAIVSSHAAGDRLLLDGNPLDGAEASGLIKPRPGAHRLALLAANGHVLDAVLFTVR